MIVKGEADAEYRSRVLPLGIYFPLYNMLVLNTRQHVGIVHYTSIVHYMSIV
jgi:hypothetical protein